MLTNLLENPDSSDEIKEITITGLCKLVNARIVTDPKVLMPFSTYVFETALLTLQFH